MIPKPPRSTGILVAFLLLGVACGPGSTGGSSPSDTSPFKVGVMQDLTGPIGPYGQFELQGAQLAVDDANAAGGVSGRKISIVQEDTASNKANTPASMRKLADQGVVGIIGPSSSSALVLGAPVAQQLGITLIAPSSVEQFKDPVLNDWTFRVSPTEAPAFGNLMKKFQGALGSFKRVAIFYDAANNTSIQEVQLLNDNASKLGYQVVATEASPEGQTDVASSVSKIAAANPDAIWISHLVAESAAFMRQIRARGVAAPFFGGAPLATANIFKVAGPAGEGTVTFVPFLITSPDPRAQAFVKAFKAKFNADPDQFAAVGHDATLVLLYAVKAAKSTDRKAVRDAIAKLKNVPGAIGDISYGSGPDNSNPNFILVKVKDGAFVPV